MGDVTGTSLADLLVKRALIDDQINDFRKRYIAEVRNEILEYGWDLKKMGQEIGAPAPVPRKAPKGFTNKPTRHWVDPGNPKNVYRGRGIPAWMREQMEELGYDPENKDHRNTFRDTLTEVPLA